jgi:hypothetical protein
MSEDLITVWYDGQPLIRFDETGKHVVLPEGVRHARINGALLDVGNGLLAKLADDKQKVDLAMVNPYRTAMDSVEEVYKNTSSRGIVTRKGVAAVVAAIVKIAARSIQ